MCRACVGADEVVSALLEAGAQVDASDNFGETALFVAANAGNRAIVVSLLEAGANANKKDKQHNTPLFRAAAKGYLAVAAALLDGATLLHNYRLPLLALSHLFLMQVVRTRTRKATSRTMLVAGKREWQN